MTEIKKENFDIAIESILPVFPILSGVEERIKKHAVEIRIVAGQKIVIRCNDKNYFLPYKATQSELENSLYLICNKSIHTYEREISEGYITVKGGHRIGICGTGVYKNGLLSAFNNISSINIRIARQWIGCAEQLINLFGKRINGLVIVGKPLSGKTTLLRDLCREIGSTFRLAIIDERNEISASYKGIPQFSVGELSDVYSFVNKKDGIIRALRSLSPDYIVMDELGADISDVINCMNSGCGIIMTAHSTENDFVKDRYISELLKTGAISHLAFLGDKIGDIIRIEEIKDNDSVHNIYTEYNYRIPDGKLPSLSG